MVWAGLGGSGADPSRGSTASGAGWVSIVASEDFSGCSRRGLAGRFGRFFSAVEISGLTEMAYPPPGVTISAANCRVYHNQAPLILITITWAGPNPFHMLTIER